MDVALLGQRLLDGLANGSLYGSLALAISLIYRSTGRVNLAQGELATFGTYASLVLSSPATPALAGTLFVARWVPASPWPLWLAIPAAMAVSALLAALLERFVLRRIPEHDERAALSLSVALLLLLNAGTTQIFGGGSKPYLSPFPNDSTDQWVFAGVRLRYTTVGTWAVLLTVLALLHLFLLRSRFGLAFRAVSSNRTYSALCGIRVSRVLSGGWALAAALGTLVGCLAANRLVLSPTMMTRLLVFALVAATIGGLSSPGGALLGGVIVGVGQSLLGAYVPRVDGVLAFPLLVFAMVVMLFVRPGGLFGAAGMRAQRIDHDATTALAAPAVTLDVAPRWAVVRNSPVHRLLLAALGLAVLAAAVLPPFVLPFLEARMTTEIVATTIALWGLGFLVGDGGRISLAHATFMGVGAYSTAIVAARYDIHPFIGVAIAAVVGFVAGGLLSLPAMRIRGQYLAMVTFALAVIFPSLLNRFKWFTGGEFGPPPTDVPRGPSWLHLPADRTFAFLHLVAVAVAVLLGWMLHNLRSGSFGRAVRAAAQHEAAAISVGVNAARVRTLTFAATTALSAVGGALVALQTQAVTASRYDVFRSVALYAMVAMFGAGSLLGATLAALAFVGTPYVIIELDLPIGGRGVPPDAPGGGAYLVWGVALVVATVFAPAGLVPRLRRRFATVLQIVDDDHPEAFAAPRQRSDDDDVEPKRRVRSGRRLGRSSPTDADADDGLILLDVDRPLGPPR